MRGGGGHGGQRSVHVSCKEVFKGHPLKIYVVRMEGAKEESDGKRGCRGGGGVIE